MSRTHRDIQAEKYSQLWRRWFPDGVQWSSAHLPRDWYQQEDHVLNRPHHGILWCRARWEGFYIRYAHRKERRFVKSTLKRGDVDSYERRRKRGYW